MPGVEVTFVDSKTAHECTVVPRTKNGDIGSVATFPLNGNRRTIVTPRSTSPAVFQVKGLDTEMTVVVARGAAPVVVLPKATVFIPYRGVPVKISGVTISGAE